MILDPQRLTLAPRAGTLGVLAWAPDYGTTAPIWQLTHDPLSGDGWFGLRHEPTDSWPLWVSDDDQVVHSETDIEIQGSPVLTEAADSLDATTLDGLDSAQFLRSDVADEAAELNVTGTLSQAGSAVRTTADDETVRPSISDDGAQISAGPHDISFGANLDVGADGDGSVTVTASADAGDTHTDVSDDGTLAVSSVADINFATNLGVTDDGDGTVTVDATDTDTHVDVTDDAAAVASDIGTLDAGGNLSATDNGDGSVTLAAEASRTAVSDDGTEVVSDPTDVNFGSNLVVSDDGDGTVTVDAQGGSDADTLDGLDSAQFLRSDAADGLAGPITLDLGTATTFGATTDLATGGTDNTIVTVFACDDVNTATNAVGDAVWRRNVATSDPAALEVYDRAAGESRFRVYDAGDIDLHGGEARNFRVENLDSDPANPQPGRLWVVV